MIREAHGNPYAEGFGMLPLEQPGLADVKLTLDPSVLSKNVGVLRNVMGIDPYAMKARRCDQSKVLGDIQNVVGSFNGDLHSEQVYRRPASPISTHLLQEA